MTRTIRIHLLLGALGAILLAGPLSADADADTPLPNERAINQWVNEELCMDPITNRSFNDGQTIRMVPCELDDAGAAVVRRQQWDVVAVDPAAARDNDYRAGVIVRSRQDPDFCLDANRQQAPANGTEVTLWTCDGSPEQVWHLYAIKRGSTVHAADCGGPHRACYLVNHYATERNGYRPMVLDRAAADGTLSLYNFDGTPSQRFDVTRPLEMGRIRTVTLESGGAIQPYWFSRTSCVELNPARPTVCLTSSRLP